MIFETEQDRDYAAADRDRLWGAWPREGGEVETTMSDEMTLDFERAMHRDTVNGFQQALAEKDQQIAALTAERDQWEAEAMTHRRKAKDEYWVWQGDGTDHPESLGCPVLIHASDMRALLAELAQAKERAGKLEAEQGMREMGFTPQPPRCESKTVSVWISREIFKRGVDSYVHVWSGRPTEISPGRFTWGWKAEHEVDPLGVCSIEALRRIRSDIPIPEPGECIEVAEALAPQPPAARSGTESEAI